MQNTHPVKLELLSLKFEEELGESLECIISLMKGLQNYGEIKFTIDEKIHTVEF